MNKIRPRFFPTRHSIFLLKTRGIRNQSTFNKRALHLMLRGALLAVAVLLAIGAHASMKKITAKNSTACIECADKQYCCDGESCCNNGQFCCPSSSSCCQDTCCDRATESCCADPVNGDVCCIKENTFCCPPQPSLDLPSRCCPRWYVCCDGGRFGCCDPDTMVPSEQLEAFGLFLEPTWLGPMVFNAATIDVKSGTRTEVGVTGFHTEQETTRTFMFDKVASMFYLLQANFTAPQNSSSDVPAYPIHLFKIDPTTGLTQSLLVQGAVNEVTGYRFLHRRRVIVMATWWYSSPTAADASSSSPSSSGSPPAPVGYIFYHVDIDTAVATEVGRMANPSNGTDTYAGWFHESSADGSLLYRLGYEDVVQSLNFGIGVVNLSAKPSPTLSWTTLPRPDGTHGHYRTLNLWHGNGPLKSADTDEGPGDRVAFLSLAPTYNLTRAGDLSLFAWTLSNPFGAVKVATFPNAHTTPDFGPISECLSYDETHYAAVFVQDSPLGKDFDTYGIGLVRLDGGNSSGREVMLTPEMVAVTVSVSGLGIPANSSVWSLI
jgi:hypothetical protein